MAPRSDTTRRAAEPQQFRRKQPASGTAREDSDDELGSDDLPWEWIYSVEPPAHGDDGDGHGDSKRRKVSGSKIVGARTGSFQCRVGDCVLLKADGSNDAWVAIICEFIDGDADDGMAANFMWFSTEKEIRNKNKKRNDFYWVFPGPISLSWRACSRLTSYAPERTLHFPVVGREPPGLHQRQGTGHVAPALSQKVPLRKGGAPSPRLWQDLHLPPRLQHPHRDVHGRVRLGGHLPRWGRHL